ncbi:glycerol dehydratase reactivase beta/small subunit family protein [Thermosediminibacter litoriperuensis]|uniref:Dehydratase medium subunit n=1 Tax=Thermosediminibacter litoriperuensis TaxID=291989 RepID=A0A5S5ASQ6_9FIRM|nr:glycerol dehydratase reactivase beta/small subunit family protein [Thermosediminibacter litoriperuensis]TYP55471.1 dehydratase medium subunit [Thermosediminibacter litoriperuensis]
MRVYEEIKPTVVIYCEDENAGNACLNRICEGLEEEGVPFEVTIATGDEPEFMAQKASRESRIGIGIFLGKDGTCLLQHTKMPYNMPIMKIHGKLAEADDYRRLGANAARLAKNIPLSF